MNNKKLKNLAESIHKDLKIMPKSNSLTIIESSKDSAIKTIKFNFKNKDDVLIIKQDEEKHTINLFEGKSTNSSCDFIVLLNIKQELKIFLCEIKSSCSPKHLQKAENQFNSSKLFLEYLLNSYAYYFNSKDFADYDLDSIKMCYIYQKLGIANKNPTNIKSNQQINFIFKAITTNNDKSHECNGYDFFAKT